MSWVLCPTLSMSENEENPSAVQAVQRKAHNILAIAV
jgi:hypothetical protein